MGVSNKHERMIKLAAEFATEGVDSRYAGYFALFNQQKFYEAHDVLEDLWLSDRKGVNGDFYKGLIQLAGAFVHLQKDRLRPSAVVFKLAQANLEKYPTTHERLNLTVVQELIARWLRQLEKDEFAVNPLHSGNVPYLALHNEAGRNEKRIVIAGGSGFIGTALAREFSKRGQAVVVLTRNPQKRADGVQEVAWDGEHAGEWIQYLDGAESVINLAGKNINCPHTRKNLRQIHASRVNSVFALVAAIKQCKVPPRSWIQASAVGYYGDTGDTPADESAPNGTNVLAQICHDWEEAAAISKLPLTRQVTLRIGFVLGRDGGALPVLATLARFYLGGAAGDGRQYISWIHLADLVQMFVAAVADDNLSGVFNAAAPSPVTNVEFMQQLRRALHRPWSPPAPGWAVKLGAWLMRGESSLALASQRCIPRRFVETGYQFRFGDLNVALRNLCRKP